MRELHGCPFVGEELAGSAGVEMDAGEFGGASENGILACGDLGARGENDFVRCDAEFLEAFAIGHDEVGDCDGDTVKDLNIRTIREWVMDGLHDAAGAVVTENCPAMLELHDASEDFRGGSRIAVNQNDEFSGEDTFALRLGHLRFLAFA